MTFRDPFSTVKTFDDKGFLRVNIVNFLQHEGRPGDFYTAINELQAVREALTAAFEAGTIIQFQSGFEFYKEAINWLRLIAPISNGYSVPQISSYDDINEPIASSFLQYVRWFRDNYLSGQPLYQTIQANIGSIKADKLKYLQLKADEYSDEFKQSLYDSQKQLAEASDERIRTLSSELSQQFNSQTEILNRSAVEAVNEIKRAQSLTIWHEAYEKNIADYDTRLNGKAWHPVEYRNRWRNLKLKMNQIGLSWRYYKYPRQDLFTFDWPTSKKEVKVLWYLFLRSIKFIVIVIARTLEYLISRLIVSLKAQRAIWFTILGFVLVVQSLVFLAFLAKGSLKDTQFDEILNGTFLSSLASNEFIFAKVSIFIGLILVPSLGYAFANRNYRIYANLLEQYRHRATVAQTIQGILRYVDESEANKDIRVSLPTVAAVAMFEMKNVGHLSKRDADTLPMAEVLQSVVKRS